jgi:hypothetical protein
LYFNYPELALLSQGMAMAISDVALFLLLVTIAFGLIFHPPQPLKANARQTLLEK